MGPSESIYEIFQQHMPTVSISTCFELKVKANDAKDVDKHSYSSSPWTGCKELPCSSSLPHSAAIATTVLYSLYCGSPSVGGGRVPCLALNTFGVLELALQCVSSSRCTSLTDNCVQRKARWPRDCLPPRWPTPTRQQRSRSRPNFLSLREPFQDFLSWP